MERGARTHARTHAAATMLEAAATMLEAEAGVQPQGRPPGAGRGDTGPVPSDLRGRAALQPPGPRDKAFLALKPVAGGRLPVAGGRLPEPLETGLFSSPSPLGPHRDQGEERRLRGQDT